MFVALPFMAAVWMNAFDRVVQISGWWYNSCTHAVRLDAISRQAKPYEPCNSGIILHKCKDD